MNDRHSAVPGWWTSVASPQRWSRRVGKSLNRATVWVAVALCGAAIVWQPPVAWSQETPTPQTPAPQPTAPQPTAPQPTAPQPQVNAPQELKLEEALPLFAGAERAALEKWQAKPAQPVDPPQILTAIDSLQLSQVFFGFGQNGQNRFLLTRLVLANLTPNPLRWKREDLVLSVDGNPQNPKEAPQQMQFHGVQVGNRHVPLREATFPESVEFPPGQIRSVWVLFPEIPGGGTVPKLQLRLKLGPETREHDLNALARERLKIEVVRRGPRQALGLVTIGGELNTLAVGVLAEELDQLAAAKLTRAVVVFQPGASIPDQQLHQWLIGVATALGRGAQMGEGPFPALPSALRELHLAKLPQPGQNQPAPQAPNTTPAQPAGAPPAPAGVNPAAPPVSLAPAVLFEQSMPGFGSRTHATELDAVVAALRTAFLSLPRAEVEASVGSADLGERVAALAAGAGRLAADKLPQILEAATHDELPVQQAALAALGQFGDDAALGRLVATARKNEEPLCSTALASLATSRFAGAPQALLQLLADEPAELKKKIVKTFATYPKSAWSEALYEFVSEARRGEEPAPPPDLLATAMSSLVQVGHPRLGEILRESLQSPNVHLRQQALDVLVSRSDRESERVALDYTLSWLQSEDNREVDPPGTMFQLLGRVKDPRAIPLLQSRFATSKNRLPLLQTLATLGDLATSRWLREKYSDLQPQEKGEVLRLMVRLNKPQFREMAGEVLGNQDGNLWNYAVQGLQEDGSPEAVELMVRMLDKSDQSGQFAQLMYVLANTGTTAARQALIKARDSGNAEKRNIAVNALQNMRNRSPGYQYYAQAHSLMQQKKYKEAIEQFGASLQADPQFSDSLSERGLCHLYLQQHKEALTDFAKCLELDPYNHLAVTGECLALILGPGQVPEAMQKLQGAREKFPKNAVFHYNAACVAGRAAELVAKQDPSPERDARLAEYRKAGLADLKTAIEQGFDDSDLMAEDADLKAFHDLPEWQELRKSLPAKPAAGQQAQRAAGAAAGLKNIIQQRIRNVLPVKK